MAPRPLPHPVLCLVTDRHLCLDAPLASKVSQAIEGGVNMVQIREKDILSERLLELSQEIRQAIDGRALLMINGRIDVAIACRADGIHLAEDGLELSVLRRIAGDDFLVGRSVHSLEGALRAQNEGVDYLMAGTIFETSSHPGFLSTGVSFLRELRSAVRIPYIGIGGITSDNAANVVGAGAYGAAVISSILAADEPKDASKALWKAVN